LLCFQRTTHFSRARLSFFSLSFPPASSGDCFLRRCLRWMPACILPILVLTLRFLQRTPPIVGSLPSINVRVPLATTSANRLVPPLPVSCPTLSHPLHALTLLPTFWIALPRPRYIATATTHTSLPRSATHKFCAMGPFPPQFPPRDAFYTPLKTTLCVRGANVLVALFFLPDQCLLPLDSFFDVLIP